MLFDVVAVVEDIIEFHGRGWSRCWRHHGLGMELRRIAEMALNFIEQASNRILARLRFAL